MLDQPERVVYTVTVTVPPVGDGGRTVVDTYEKIGGIKIVPGETALLVLMDTDGRHRAILAMAPGYALNFIVTETLKPIDLSIPGTLVNHDFTKAH